jgi:hypothetical protein
MRLSKLILCVTAAGLYSARAADPVCDRGIRAPNAADAVCCAAQCGACGGVACHTRPGGVDACCVTGVKASRRACPSDEAPCNLRATAPAGGGAAVERHIAMHPGDKSVFERNREYGTKVDTLIMYQKVKYLQWPWVKANLDAGLHVTVIIEFMDTYPNLRDIANGKYDWQLRQFAEDARRDGRPFRIRTLHEFNGTWYEWSVYNGGSNSVQAFKDAYRHVVELFKSYKLNAKYQLSYNSKTIPVSSKESFRDFYPGDDVVDEICVSAYNFVGTDQWHTASTSIGEVIRPWYDAMAFNKKPLCIAEMSSTDARGKKPEWIAETWRSLARDFPRVTEIAWFFENKGNHDFDLNSAAQERAFADGFWAYRRAFPSSFGDQQRSGDEPTLRFDPNAAERARLEGEAIDAGIQYHEEIDERGLG